MDIGKVFIIIGFVFVFFGALFALGFKGLPGDIVIEKKNAVVIFPIATSLALSLLISLILLLMRK